MTDYYVKTDGSDSKDGRSVTNAWQHPSHATQIAKAGDTIYLLDGTWHDEKCVFANSGTAGSPITITAYSGTPTLIGTKTSGTAGIRVNHKNYITISNIKIKGYGHTIDYPGDYLTVSNCDLSDTEGVVIVLSQHDSTHNTIENCTLYDSGWNTVQMSGNREETGNPPATYITVRNCIIYNSKVHAAIDLYGNLQYVTIEDNELYNNPAGCIYDHDNPDHREYITIRNNHFHDVGSEPLNIGMDSHFEIYNNTFETIYSGASKTHPIYIYLNSHDFEIYNNRFYDCGTIRIVGGYNFIFDDNYIHSDGDMYSATHGANIVVKNPRGYKDVYLGDPSSTAELLYDDGTVFTADFYWLGSYVPVRYYPTKSSASGVAKSNDWGTINTVISYSITLRPTSAYLTASAITDTAITIESTIANNPTTITNILPAMASSSVELIVDGTTYQTKTADSSGFVSFVYNGTWDKPHAFGWKKGGVTPPPQEHTIIVQIPTGSVLKVGGIVR